MKRSAHGLAAICSLVLALLAGVLVAAPATAEGAPHTQVASQVPGTNSPQVVDGRVFAITQVGSTTVIGGTFTQVQPYNRSTTYNQPYIAAFDATTGALNTAFVPQLDGQVESVVPGPTPGTVYAAGYFNNAAGVRSKSVVLLNLSNGSRVTTFRPAAMNGAVRSLRMIGQRLYIGGTFTTVGGVAHGGVAALNATTGAVDAFVSSSVTENHNWTEGSSNAKAAVGVFALDVTPDGSQLAIIGNFRKVDGLDRRQVALFDLTGSTAVVRPDWRARGYEAACYSWAYDTYMRDIDFAPDGASFAIATTGGGNNTLCDTAARFETSATGDDVKPTWTAYAGGDSLLSIAMTGEAVYTGGHQRWMNNPQGNDFAGPGAVPRPGLAGLDVKNGVPLAWNPGRNPRGAGAYSLYASSTGLWVGSDTDWVGDSYNYRRQKIAFFPLGVPAHTDEVQALPAGVFLGAPQQGSSNVLHRVNAGGPLVASVDAGPDWAADTDSTSPYRNEGSNAVGWGPVSSLDPSVPAGTPATVFESERWDPGSAGDGGEMSWAFPVQAGTQVEVRVYLSNRCTCTSGAGNRVFDVSSEASTRLDDFDIVVGAGGDQRGTMRSWTVTSDGSIDIGFAHVVENPLVNAIEIVRTGAAPAPTTSVLARRDFTGTGAGPAEVVAGSVDWSTLRGATLVGTSLFYGKTTDANLYRRTFDGARLGAEVLVDPYNDPRWADRDTGSGQTFRGAKPGFYGEIPNLASMFYDGEGRLYYTLTTSSGLFYRAFSPDSGIVHPQRQQVAGASLPALSGAFVSGGQLYYVPRSTGQMVRVAFDGSTVSGTPTVVSGPAEDGVDWRAKVLFVGPESEPNTPPVASSTVGCTYLVCSFDGRASTDPDGSIASYAWTFGDGTTSTEPNGTHTYTADSTYEVTLVVTDARGATHQVTRTVTAAARVNAAPTARFTATCATLSCSFDGSTSSDDSAVIAYAWDFGDATPAVVGPTATHAYAAPGTYTVTLTVSDDEGATGTTSEQVTVQAEPSSDVAFRATAGVSGNTGRPVVTVPSAVQVGDALVLTVSTGTATNHAPPAGWSQVVRVQGSALTTVWQKVATASDAGSSVPVVLTGMSGTVTKVNVRLLAYSGTATTSPVTATASADPSNTTRHTAPAATVATAGSWVVRYFADRSSTTTLWTPASGLTVRALDYGSASGRVSALVGDQGGPVAAGSVPAATSTTDVASRGNAVTLVLAPRS